MQFPWNRRESDLKRELAHHLHQLTAEYERQGHSHEEAMWMAKREFGGSEQVKERCRDERRGHGCLVSGRILPSPFARCAVLPALPSPPSLFWRWASPRMLSFSACCTRWSCGPWMCLMQTG